MQREMAPGRTEGEPNLSPKEVAAVIGCSTETVKKACRAGELGFKFRGCWYIPRSQVDQIRNGGVPVTAITEQRVALVRTAVANSAASLNAVVAETGLRRTIVQDCLRRLGYRWNTGDGPLRKGRS